MAAINKHGRKMIGLRAAAGDTKGLCGYYSGHYAELFYDCSTGEVWTIYQVSLGQNTWTEYHDSNVIKICNISEPMTMQEIADTINDCISEHSYCEECERHAAMGI